MTKHFYLRDLFWLTFAVGVGLGTALPAYRWGVTDGKTEAAEEIAQLRAVKFAVNMILTGPRLRTITVPSPTRGTGLAVYTQDFTNLDREWDRLAEDDPYYQPLESPPAKATVAP